MFKKIAEAYAVLSDENKRKLYDQYGKDGLNEQNTHAGAEEDDEHYGHYGESFGPQFTFSFDM